MRNQFLGVRRIPKILTGKLTLRDKWRKILGEGYFFPKCVNCGRKLEIKSLEYTYVYPLSRFFPLIPPRSNNELKVVFICPFCGIFIEAKGKGLHVSNRGFWIDEIEEVLVVERK